LLNGPAIGGLNLLLYCSHLVHDGIAVVGCHLQDEVVVISNQGANLAHPFGGYIIDGAMRPFRNLLLKAGDAGVAALDLAILGDRLSGNYLQ
jgi:hypothetical protein